MVTIKIAQQQVQAAALQVEVTWTGII
jgi:hypothetical protein